MRTLDYYAAYGVMFFFLHEELWLKRRSEFPDELPGLLGNMNIQKATGLPMAQYMWADWKRTTGESAAMTEEEIYAAMLRYVTDFFHLQRNAENEYLVTILQTPSADLRASWHKLFDEFYKRVHAA